jgi:S1-C subfamily serine protease
MVMGFRALLVAAALLLDSSGLSTLIKGAALRDLVLVQRGRATSAQQVTVLRIKVTIVDADRHAMAVPRHALLISDNPTSAAPQRVVTALDGTAEVRLRPGNYTVESDQPLIFQGKAYEWRQTLDVAEGRVTSLELTADNAQIEAASAASPSVSSPSAAEGNASALLIDWQNSVVSIWSPTKRGSGFLIDARGLIATNQRLVGGAKSLEVQLSSSDKVAARVLASDPDRNVAILWIDPKAVASARPVKLGYADGGPPPAAKDRLFAISAPIHDEKSMTSGTVTRVAAHSILSDVRMDEDSLGAPLFNAAGLVVAITTPDDDTSRASSAALRAVRIDEARSVIADAEKKMQKAEAPNGTRLPVEPQRPFDDEVLKEGARRRAGNLSPYRVPAADFDVSLITPVLVYGAHHQGDRVGGREPQRVGRDLGELQAPLRALQDFANWSDYVRDDPPVLMIRATPKLVEGFWTTVARGAAQTQGVSLPPIKRLKAGFWRMRIFCGDAEVTPIHPFIIEQRLSENNVMYEGLYVFDPAAIGPHCGTVKLTLFSDKDPEKGDTRVIDPKILEQIWQDFAPYRAAAQGKA